MNELIKKPNPWLIAAWPGMGNVAVIAAGYLVHALKMKQTAELPSRNHFEAGGVEVNDGLVAGVKKPRGVFFRWDNPAGGRDLLVFLSEAQPTRGVYAYANELLEMATGLGAERVVTFASMATPLHPADSPKVLGMTTDADLMDELRRAEVDPLTEGQVGGLSGVVLAAAAERGVPGMGLLAEIPFFAASAPNPKAARAALSVFSVLAGIDVSLKRLNQHADVMDQALTEAFERYQAEQGLDEEDQVDEVPEAIAESEAKSDAISESAEEAAEGMKTGLDIAARRRLERMFWEAKADVAKARTLKEELDRLGVFKMYEDRFLDLFRRAA